MKTKMHSLILLAVALLGAGALGFLATAAASDGSFSYPVAELGNCASEGECKTFCDQANNTDACASFAEKYNITSGDSEKAKKFRELKDKPGNCKTAGECESYCNDITHIDECVSFAEKNNFMPAADLDEAKKLQAALAKGASLPGNCKTKESCDSYCNDPSHMEECIIFGETAGLIPADEMEDAKKVLQAVKKGAKPPPCMGKQRCDSYCNEPSHVEECITFAEAAGLIPAGELEDAKKMIQAIKKGAKPPACRGKAECDAYCTEPSHVEECITFAAAAGYMTEEEAVMVRKTGGVGPGGCRSKDACDAFCNNPDNEEFCFNFALERGIIPQAQLQEMEDGRRKMQESMNGAPPEVVTCLVGALGQERVDKIKSGTGMPSRKDGDAMRMCFETFESQWQEREQRMREEQEQRDRERKEARPGGEGASEPYPQPSPEPSPSPTPEPEPTPSPEPTPGPEPSPAPEPTPTPAPEPTPSQEPTPTPAPAPEPTPTPAPAPSPEPAQ